MFRHWLLLMVVVMATASVAPVHAATGINIAGLSWHPSDDSLEWFNPGLGVRYAFLRRTDWKVDVVAGGYRDSVHDLALHAAIGAQRRVAGKVYAGLHLMAAAHDDALDEIYVAPFPSATVELGPVDLNVHYLPRIRNHTSSAAFGFHVTVWPFGGRAPIADGPTHPDGRFGLEFGIESGPSLTEFDGQTIALRWSPNGRHAWRAGYYVDALHRQRTRDRRVGGSVDTLRDSSDRARSELLIQHLWLKPARGKTRLLAGAGAQLNYEINNGVEAWVPGVVLSVGGEADLIDGLSLLAEYVTTTAWNIVELPPELSSSRVELRTRARLGVALWW